MRLLVLALGLAACSSPAATTATTTPPPIDEPPVDLGPCLPAQIDLIGAQGAVLHMCEVEDDQSCFDLEPNGRVTPTGGDVDPPTFEIDGTTVTRCASSASCTSFDVPVEPRWAFTDAGDGPGELLGVALQFGAEGDDSPGRIEVWDPTVPARLASADVDTDSYVERRYLVDFVGDAVLSIIESMNGDSEASLWRLDRNRLTHVADLSQGPLDWVTVAPGLGAFVLGSTIRISDLATGDEVATVDWSDVVEGDAPLEDAELYLYDGAVAGTFALAVDAYEDGPLAGVGMVDDEGVVTRYPVNVCPMVGIGD